MNSPNHPFTTHMQNTEKVGIVPSDFLKVDDVDPSVPTATIPTDSAIYNACSIPNFAEALASPVKYALFQVLGYEFIRTMGPIDISLYFSGSLGSSACIGALGGGVLAIVYLALLFSRGQESRKDNSTLRSISSSLFQDLGKEILYSAFAAVIGAAITGRDAYDNLSYLIIAGLLGPIVASIIMLGALGFVIGVAWGCFKLKDRLTRY